MRKKKNTNKLEKIVTMVFLVVIIAIATYFNSEWDSSNKENALDNTEISYEMSNIPSYSGKIYVEINNNVPEFSDEDINITEDYYSSLKNGRARNGYDKN